MKSTRPGFTLIELIIVITIIVIIAAAAFVALDPARRLNAARNSTRWSDVTAILDAVKKYTVDNDGDFPSTATAVDAGATASGSIQIIGDDVTCSTHTCSLSLSFPASNCGATGLDTDLRPYLRTLPTDPKTGSGGDTRYYINRDIYGILTVGACDAEGEGGGGGGTPPTIEITR